MKRILFVDDDAIVVRIYKEALSRHGFEVEAAHDGLVANKALLASKPDLIVLDLMMPKLSGVDVLKFVRGTPQLADLPIIVLSNSYMDSLARDAAAAGTQKALLKVRCTPSILIQAIGEILEGKPADQETSLLLATEQTEAEAPREKAAPARPRQPTAAPTQPAAGQNLSPQNSPAPPSAAADKEFRAKARKHFLETSAATSSALHQAFQAFARARDNNERDIQLQHLYRRVHFLGASAGLAGFDPIARMASVFEAMLFELSNKPGLISPSVLRTGALAVDQVDHLLKHARGNSHDMPPSSQILVVDDDALSNKVVVTALRQAQLPARSAEDPMVALQWLRDQRYDLILLDIEMPGMDGFELCKRLRKLPGYSKTPVIYVTSHSDFESRAKSALSGGDDLIAKPVFPMELAVKAMTHLLGSQFGQKAR